MSVRVRITALATVVVAVAVAIAGFALVHIVEAKLRQRIEEADAARATFVEQKLLSGVPPSNLDVPPSWAGTVVIVNREGQVVRTAGVPLPDGNKLAIVSAPSPGQSGSVQVAAPDPGTGGEVSYNVFYKGVATSGGPLTVLAASPLDEMEQSIATLKGSLVVGLPFLVALVGCVAWFMTGRALRPVEAMRVEVETISGGTLHRRVPEPQTGDEIARLAHTMNAMLDRLENAATRQRQFASDASHELRSPVAAIRTELEVALRETKADWPAVAERVLAEEDRLESLVTDLLLLATVDEDAPVPTSDVDLTELVRAEAERARCAPVRLDLPDGPVVTAGRRAQVKRVVANLLDNACRHATSTVAVTVGAEDGTARIIVDDDGPGIAPGDRQRVFERFTRLDGSRSRGDHGGAGLGLALVRAVVDGHGGSVRIEDAPLGGARFVVSLPLRESDDRPASLASDVAEPAVGVDGNGTAAGGENGDITG